MSSNVKTENSKANCIICVHHTGIFQWILPIAVRGYCEHSKYRYSKQPLYKISRFYVVVNVFALLFTIFPLISFWLILPKLWQKDLTLSILLIGDSVYMAATMLIILSQIFLFKKYLNNFNNWLSILEKYKIFNLILPDWTSATRKGRIFVYAGALMIITQTTLLVVHPYDEFEYHVIRKITFFVIEVFQWFIVFEYYQTLHLIGGFLISVEENVKNCRLLRANGAVIGERIKKIQYVYLNIYENLNDFNKKNYYLTIQWVLMTTFGVILYTFSIVILPYSLETLNFECRAAICCFVVVYLMWVAESQINRKSEDILSFLFKYPISKLTPAEAAQVEVLITTLTVQKPVIRASDVFIVGTRLLASISGTVVTYVLVALQFHATWSQE